MEKLYITVTVSDWTGLNKKKYVETFIIDT